MIDVWSSMSTSTNMNYGYTHQHTHASRIPGRSAPPDPTPNTWNGPDIQVDVDHAPSPIILQFLQRSASLPRILGSF